MEPRRGRFLTVDPFAGLRRDPRTLHRYSYVGGDPVNGHDPSGEVGEEFAEGAMEELEVEAEMDAQEVQLVQPMTELAEDTSITATELEVEPVEGILEAEESGVDITGEVEEEAEVVDEAATETEWGEPSSRELRANMREAGVEEPEYPNAAHHIVAGRAPAAQAARTHLTRLGVQANEAENGVFLRVSEEGEGAIHTRIHTRVYYEEVNRLVLRATTREEALEVLKSIADQLRAGTFPW